MRIAPKNIKTIVAATEGSLLGNASNEIINISIDGRSNSINKNSLFVALKGNNTDGHKFIKQAYSKGCRTFLTTTHVELKGANFIIVNDVLEALQNLAIHHRETLNIPIVGITGSYGKTTVKEWLYQLLQNKYNIARSPKSYNSQIGVPLSILSIQSNHDLAIIEAGISLPGEMEKLEKIIQPTLGVFTGIGKSHGENFSSDEEKQNEKYKLFKSATKVLSVNDKSQEQFITPFNDSASQQNANLACRVAMELGLSKKETQNNVKKLRSLALRMEVSEGKNNNIIINDSYNSDENGLEIALDFLNQKREGKPILVITSFSNSFTKRLKEEYKIDDWLVLNSERDFKHIVNKLSQIQNTAILIKGTQNTDFQTISRVLQKTNHATSLEINLTAVSNNYRVFNQKLKPETKLMAMVKAFGYGSGSVELAKHLNNLGVDYFGVAYASEGEQLRKADVQTPIMVMSPEQSSFSSIIENNLEPEIYSLDILDAFIRALINFNKKEYPIHVKVDSGMNRQGFQAHEIKELCKTINAQPEVNVVSVFSHLAASDETNHSEFTSMQINRFEEINSAIEKEIGTNYLKHILNTHGIINYPEHQYDMARLGIGLFGEDFSGKLKNQLQNVISFKTSITQIKQVKQGESIGYGRSTILTEDKIIGILPVGYADGYFRALSNKAEVFINGKKAPVIGNVCMDITMIDLTNIEANVGDKVELFGEHITLTELAEKANTISYEILTSISSRVKRVYLSE